MSEFETRTVRAGDANSPTLLVPSRRTLFLGVGTLTAAIAAGTAPAMAAGNLRRGDRGPEVTKLQQELNRRRYWCGKVDGSFGPTTQQAVYAIQKAAGLSKDGVVGPKTRGALSDGVLPKKTIGGSGFEVDLSQQLLLAVSGGTLMHVFNTSTGSGERYYSGGRWKTATTPKGDFSMYRLIKSGWQDAPLGRLYRPGYYDRGWAIHGSTSIPTYPASHGCSRISVAASDGLWSVGWFRKGMRVKVRA
ncbi:L,D-transpeptidase family protein [Brachybacterium hainanense]|uniref:Peptidoglycan-binding protein n=1 Tax=Brachybacterium hainanense TaxID=1541174 RepID=A0ABV6RFB7_9MICO